MCISTVQNTDRLNDESLKIVSGGLNPRPLPPGPGDPFVLKSSHVSHFSFLQNPKQFNDDVLHFLERQHSPEAAAK